MIDKIQTGIRRDRYIVPEAEIITIQKGGSIMTTSGEVAPDEPTPGY